VPSVAFVGGPEECLRESRRRPGTARLVVRLRALLALAFAIAGCAKAPPGVTPDRALLAFLRDGETTRSDVLLRLGEPSGSFAEERILTYRIGGDDERGRWVQGRALLAGGPPVGASRAQASLVLVFGEGGVLERHGLVPVE
jgi:hypothetical protein